MVVAAGGDRCNYRGLRRVVIGVISPIYIRHDLLSFLSCRISLPAVHTDAPRSTPRRCARAAEVPTFVPGSLRCWRIYRWDFTVGFQGNHYGCVKDLSPGWIQVTGKSRVASVEADGTNVVFFGLSLRPRSIYSLSGTIP